MCVPEGGYMKRSRQWFVGLAATVLLIAGGIATAQEFPSRVVRLIVAFPPGGSTDTTARIMAEKMRPILGQPIIIENVGGAGGSIAVGRVARAQPDGYTIDIGQWDTHVGAIVYPINFDLQKDFAPISLTGRFALLMVVNPGKLKATSVKAVIDEAMARPAAAERKLWTVSPAIWTK